MGEAKPPAVTPRARSLFASRVVGFAVVGLMAVVGLAGACIGGCIEEANAKPKAASPVPPPGKAGQSLHQRFGEWDFLTLIDAPKTVAVKGGGEFAANASTCGACHQDNYREWRDSTHANALRDPQYLAELAKSSSPRWLCLGCHIPLKNQREQLVDGDTKLLSSGYDIGTIDDRKNPDFDRTLQTEAITCATCHVRRGPDGKGVVIGPRGDPIAPHFVKKDPKALNDICVRCHSPGEAQLTPTFVCWFETAEELAAGPYAGEKSCIDCHMKITERALVPGNPVRKTRQHHWQGGGVPKSFDLYDKLEHQGWVPGLEVTLTFNGLDSTVAVENKNAGHKIPTADPERHYLVRARLLDAAGKELARDVLRIGQRWDWGGLESGRVAHRIEDTRLAPRERRQWQPELPAAAFNKASSLEVDALHVRLAPGNARYAKQAKIDDELEALVPGARARGAALEKHYPLLSFIARERVDLGSGKRKKDDHAALIARSKALQSRTLEDIERIVAGGE